MDNDLALIAEQVAVACTQMRHNRNLRWRFDDGIAVQIQAVVVAPHALIRTVGQSGGDFQDALR